MKQVVPILFLLLLVSSASAEVTNISQYEFKGIDGQVHTFSEFNYTYIFIDFFATWCIPCVQSTKELIQLQDYRGDVIDILSISVSEETDSIEKILEFKEENNITWDMGIDPNMTLTLDVGVLYIPSYALISPEGDLLEFINATELPDVYDMIEVVDTFTQSTNTSLPPRTETTSENLPLTWYVVPLFALPLLRRFRRIF